jgi:hypothetical protein
LSTGSASWLRLIDRNAAELVVGAGTALGLVVSSTLSYAVYEVAGLVAAEYLQQRGVPFVVLTGYDTNDIPCHLRDRSVLHKPSALKRYAIKGWSAGRTPRPVHAVAQTLSGTVQGAQPVTPKDGLDLLGPHRL